jgi:putative heme-binding domain-containing protein
MSRSICFRVSGCAWMLAMAAALDAWGAPPPLVAPSEALTPAEQQKLFHLPPGFEIQLFASEPAIHKPMNITFDAAGRLFVTDTLEYPYPAKKGSVPRDTVKILADRDLDGAADEITTFVDGLNIPLGVQPIPGGVIVYGIPEVMRCLDKDGDGKAETREPLYQGFGFRDTHGMVNSFTRGLDGWLYACHGFSNDSQPQGADGQGIAMNSGNTFRMRLDGGHIEYVTHGQVNPFGLAFDPLGNMYTADCHTLPVYMLLRGAYYPSFGKAHDGLGFGPTMIGHDHGSTGIGGIAYYAANQFPAEYRDTLLIGNPVTGRVNHDRLQRHGSTYQAVELPDFIRCDDPWFRPVNLQVGPDGALYVADFYNRIIGHYEVPLEHPGRDRERGRIWRVVYTGKGVDAPAKTAPAIGPDVSTAPLRRLLELLGDDNLTVRTLATDEIVDRYGQQAKEPLTKLLDASGGNPWQRVHGMWALERLGGFDDELLGNLAGDSDPAVRVHVIKLLGERNWEKSPLVDAALSDNDAFVLRAAADALARHAHADNVKPLLALWAATPADDTHLIHAARMALRDQLIKPGVYAQLPSLAGDDRQSLRRLAEVSLGVPNAESAAFVWTRMQDDAELPNRETYLHHVARYIAEEQLGDVLSAVQKSSAGDTSARAGLMRAVGRGSQERGAALPAETIAWGGSLAAELMAADDERTVRQGLELARDFSLPMYEQLAAAAQPDARFGSLRSAALEACAANDAARSVPLATEILADAAESVAQRQHAAGVLARINDEAARGALLTVLQAAPERLAVEIAAALAESSQGAEALLAAVESGKASARLLQEKNVVTRLQARKLSDFETRLAKLTDRLPPADQRIRELIEKRRELVVAGSHDLAVGAALFQKHCAACHRIGEKGEKIGPNLDGVGIRGVDRLLEDVLDPSRNVDQAFRTTQIVTGDGQIVTGLALREEGEILVLADAQGKEIRLAKDQIDQRAVSQLSLMPSNVPDLISEVEFAHLVGYLLSQRAAPAEPAK